MIPIQDYKQDIVWVNKQNNTELLSFISKIGTEKSQTNYLYKKTFVDLLPMGMIFSL